MYEILNKIESDLERDMKLTDTEIDQIERNYIETECNNWNNIHDYMVNMPPRIADAIMEARQAGDLTQIGYVFNEGLTEFIKEHHKIQIDEFVRERENELRFAS